MSGNIGGQDPVAFVQGLKGRSSQKPQWPATLDVDAASYEQITHATSRRVSLKPLPADWKWKQEQ